MKNTQFVIITGLSGSGKSLAQKCFEDMGFFCVDNLPTSLIPTFFELCSRTGEEFRRVAVVSDVRERKFISEFPAVLDEIIAAGYNIKLLFLEAKAEILARRFSESRRPHPLGQQRALEEVIREEMNLLKGLRERADMIIDTSNSTVHELKEMLRGRFPLEEPDRSMVISVASFGYKYGIPYDSDLLFDARFLPNPYFVDTLKRQTGLDKEVDQYLQADPRTREFLENLFRFLDYLVPRYIQEGKSYLKIAIGCTGGRHRSPALVMHLKEHLQASSYKVIAAHRDIERE